MSYIDILNNPVLVLILLLILNVLVVFLYSHEYRKNKRSAVELQQAIDLLRQMVGKDQQSIEQEKSFLAQFSEQSEGLDKLEGAKGQALTILNEATKQAASIVREAQTLQQRTHHQFLESQAKANQKSEQILQESQVKAQAILTDATGFRDKAQVLLEQGLTTTIEQAKTLIADQQETLLKKYEASFEKAYDEYINLLQKQNNDTAETARKMAQDFLEVLKDQTIKASSQRTEYAEKELGDIKTELTAYKDHEMAKIEGNIYEILSRASESVIGQAVNFDLHQDLIIKALEQAKREGIFV